MSNLLFELDCIYIHVCECVIFISDSDISFVQDYDSDDTFSLLVELGSLTNYILNIKLILLIIYVLILTNNNS